LRNSGVTLVLMSTVSGSSISSFTTSRVRLTVDPAATDVSTVVVR
jgi:hypothetical protein